MKRAHSGQNITAISMYLMKKNILSQDLFEIYFITCSNQFYTCIESTFSPNSRYLIECALHYVKSVRIPSFSRQYFLAFGLNTE